MSSGCRPYATQMTAAVSGRGSHGSADYWQL